MNNYNQFIENLKTLNKKPCIHHKQNTWWYINNTWVMYQNQKLNTLWVNMDSIQYLIEQIDIEYLEEIINEHFKLKLAYSEGQAAKNMDAHLYDDIIRDIQPLFNID